MGPDLINSPTAAAGESRSDQESPAWLAGAGTTRHRPLSSPSCSSPSHFHLIHPRCSALPCMSPWICLCLPSFILLRLPWSALRPGRGRVFHSHSPLECSPARWPRYCSRLDLSEVSLFVSLLDARPSFPPSPSSCIPRSFKLLQPPCPQTLSIISWEVDDSLSPCALY